MISSRDMRRALDKIPGITITDRQLNDLMNDLLPNPQSGFSCDGATVWGDRQSIDKVQGWNYAASTIASWRSQFDGMQARAMRAEELGIRCLDFVLRVSAMNPASAGPAVGLAASLLEAHGIEPREGFFRDDGDSEADARTKFYAAAHPKKI